MIHTVLGADLSLNRPGFSVIAVTKDKKVFQLGTFNVDNKRRAGKVPRGDILTQIAEKLRSLIKTYHPDILVREASINNAGFGRRSGTAARTGISEVVGVCDLIAWETKQQWNELYPVTIKKQVTGNGKSDKAEVADALNKYICKCEWACDDESDAAAAAIAYLLKENIIPQAKVEESNIDTDSNCTSK